jgi:hypothetical protein
MHSSSEKTKLLDNKDENYDLAIPDILLIYVMQRDFVYLFMRTHNMITFLLSEECFSFPLRMIKYSRLSVAYIKYECLEWIPLTKMF